MEQRCGPIPSLQILLFSFLSCQAPPSPTGTAKHGVLYSHPLLWCASLANPSIPLYSFQSHYVGHDIQPELALVPGALHPCHGRELAEWELQLCLTQAALQVIAFAVAEAVVVKYGLPKTVFPLLSPDFTLFDRAVYRGFWTAFIMLAVAAGLVGGLLLVCGMPFVSPRSYKVGGGFLLASGKLPSCGNGIRLGRECSGHAPLRACRERGGSRGWGAAGCSWGLWWELHWLGVNDFLLPPLEINLYAQSSFNKIVLSPTPREAGVWEKYFFLFFPLLFYATQRSRAFYFSRVRSSVNPGQQSATLCSPKSVFAFGPLLSLLLGSGRAGNPLRNERHTWQFKMGGLA